MKKSFILIFITFLFLTACATNPVTGKTELMFLSEQDEINLGRSTYPNAIWGAEGGGGEYKDESLRLYLNDIVKRLHSVSHRPNLPVQFTIQNTSVPNAWAIPGYVTITRGLLANLENEGEFAFVLGHEIGHVSARHSASQLSQAILLQVGLAAVGLTLSKKDYGDLVVGLGAIGGIFILRKYTRDDELLADRLGVQYMTSAGYDPRNAVSAHITLQRAVNNYYRQIGEEPEERTFLDDLLASHPRTKTRIEEIEKLIPLYRVVKYYGDGSNRQIFQTMIADLKRVNDIYVNYYDKAVRAYKRGSLNEAQTLLHHAITLDRYQAPFYALTGFVFLDRRNFDEAERYFNGALTIDNNHQPAYRGLGMISYYKKYYEGAIMTLKKALKLYPEDIASHYFIGMSYYKTNQCENAIPHLSNVASASTNHRNVHGILGICYERIGMIEDAVGAYEKQINNDPFSNIGRYASERYRILKAELDRKKQEEKSKKEKK